MSEAGFARANIDYGILPRYGLTHLLIACALAGVLLFALGRDIARMPVQARQLYSTLFFDTVVLQATRLISMGSTGLDALVQLHRQHQRRHILQVLAELNPQPLSPMQRSGFAEDLGADCIAPTWADALAHLR